MSGSEPLKAQPPWPLPGKSVTHAASVRSRRGGLSYAPGREMILPRVHEPRAELLGRPVEVLLPEQPQVNCRWRRGPNVHLCHAGVANFVAEEDIVGILPPADVYEPQRRGRLAGEQRDSFTQDEVANQQMNLVDQIMRQQIVPEGPAAR